MNDNFFILKDIDNYSYKNLNLFNDNINEKKKLNLDFSSNHIESFFINFMLKSSKSSIISEDFLENEQSKLYKSIYDQIISDKISDKGIGFKSFLEKNYKL